MTPAQETSERELLACPFCGSQNVDAEGWATLPEYAATPEERSGPACDDCGSTAPSAKIWNTRAAGDAPAWQPIETAPKDGTRIMVVYGGQTRIAQWGKTSHVPLYGFCLADQGPEDFDLVEVKFWQPLPRPDRATESSAPE